MAALATLTSKGQFTVPKEVRDAMGLKAGVRFDVTIVDGSLVATPRRSRAIDLAGCLGKPPRGAGSTIEEMDEAVRDAVADHVLGR